MTTTTEPPAAPSPLRRAIRTQWMVLAFYVVDALLMAGYAATGVLPGLAPWVFGVGGCGLTMLFVLAMLRGLHKRIGGALFTTAQLLSACGLMLATAALWPQIGMLLMLTLVVALSTAALQLPLKHVLAVATVIAVCSLGLLWAHGWNFSMPLDDDTMRLLSGLWFAVVLAKIAAINLIGTQMRRALSASNSRLAQALAQVQELSERDELTGLPNRRSILALLAGERARFARGGPVFGVAIIDIDHFKQVNDHFGHAMGDEVLRRFSGAVAGTLRASDRVARYGGEEFLLLLPGTTNTEGATLAAERVRNAVSAYPWPDVAPGLQLTCSIGIAVCRAGESESEMLTRADAALYRAKAEGRNAVRAG